MPVIANVAMANVCKAVRCIVGVYRFAHIIQEPVHGRLQAFAPGYRVQVMDRRDFLGSAAGIAAGLSSSRPAGATSDPEPPLPTVKFKDHQITKLLIGANPFYGYSHFNSALDKFMLEYMTQDTRIRILKTAEAAGINTWQVHYNDPTIADWKRYRDEGGKMNVLLLSDFGLHKDWTLLKQVAKLKPIGVAHHGGRTDERFREGKIEIVHDFVRAVHDAGLTAGVSTHNPAVVAYIEDKGWENDYFMTCMYRVSRTVEETRREFGEAPLGESFMEKDPERMLKMVRQASKTCFAFKVMGAGRLINQPKMIEGAFRYVLSNIKPKDAVIVGMCPKFKDEVTENVAYVSKIMATLRTT